MKTKCGIGVVIAGLLLTSLAFMPVSANEGIIPSENALSEQVMGGDDFLSCYGYLKGEQYWIRFGGWAQSYSIAGRMHIAVYLYDYNSGEKMTHTANSGQGVDYLEPQENLELHPPTGDYYVYAEAWTVAPSHDADYTSSKMRYVYDP